jgi:hypothetical protein
LKAYQTPTIFLRDNVLLSFCPDYAKVAAMKRPTFFERGWVRIPSGLALSALFYLSYDGFMGSAQKSQGEVDRLRQIDNGITSSGSVPPEMIVGGHTYRSGDLSPSAAHNLLDTVIGFELGDARLNAIVGVAAALGGLAATAFTALGVVRRLDRSLSN